MLVFPLQSGYRFQVLGDCVLYVRCLGFTCVGFGDFEPKQAIHKAENKLKYNKIEVSRPKQASHKPAISPPSQPAPVC